MKEEKINNTVQEEWMGDTTKEEGEENTVVVKECSCTFD